MTISESKRTKIILLIMLLLSSIFVLGCSTHGKGDETVIKYEFCPGKYYTTASVQQADNLIYYAVNQSEIQGSSVLDPNKNTISGSTFKSPINISDDNSGSWIADGFCTDSKNKRFTEGNYQLNFNVKSIVYSKEKELSWKDFPNWKSTPSFYTSNVNDNNHLISINHSGIEDSALTSGYSVRYRIKIYVNTYQSSQLYGQSAPTKSTYLDYSIPRTTRSVELVPILVAELFKDGQLEKVLFYPDQKAFTLNP